jgi:hypothetical protein
VKVEWVFWVIWGVQVAENGEDCTIYIASGVHVYGIKVQNHFYCVIW